MDQDAAERFATEWAADWATEWAAAWNNHDIDLLLEHFSDDVYWTSPVAAQLMPASQGVIRGKEALRHYYNLGLQRLPDLHFEVLATYKGVNTLVINYRNQKGGLVNEVLVFDETGLVKEGHGTYEVS